MNHNDSDAEKSERTAQAESINAGLPGGSEFPETGTSGATAAETEELGRAASTAVGGLVPDGSGEASD